MIKERNLSFSSPLLFLGLMSLWVWSLILILGWMPFHSFCFLFFGLVGLSTVYAGCLFCGLKSPYGRFLALLLGLSLLIGDSVGLMWSVALLPHFLGWMSLIGCIGLVLFLALSLHLWILASSLNPKLEKDFRASVSAVPASLVHAPIPLTPHDFEHPPVAFKEVADVKFHLKNSQKSEDLLPQEKSLRKAAAVLRFEEAPLFPSRASSSQFSALGMTSDHSLEEPELPYVRWHNAPKSSSLQTPDCKARTLLPLPPLSPPSTQSRPKRVDPSTRLTKLQSLPESHEFQKGYLQGIACACGHSRAGSQVWIKSGQELRSAREKGLAYDAYHRHQKKSRSSSPQSPHLHSVASKAS